MPTHSSIDWIQLLKDVQSGSVKALSRSISLITERHPGYHALLRALPVNNTPVIGITGPPGAGKSSIVNKLIGGLLKQQKKVAVLCVDPSSSFSHGAILGDRIRMCEWYNDPRVFIRSLASRGALGGLPPMVIEITDLVKAGEFDFIFVETVGVGQNEIEIAGLADITVVVLVPESGDDIQIMKAGLMEIADIFVVNKSDRPGAEKFVHSLQSLLRDSPMQRWQIVKTAAIGNEGIDELNAAIKTGLEAFSDSEKKYSLLTEKVYQLIQQERMKDLDKSQLAKHIQEQIKAGGFNLYQFIEQYPLSGYSSTTGNR